MIDKRILVGGFAIGVAIGTILVTGPNAPSWTQPKPAVTTSQKPYLIPVKADADYRRAIQLMSARDFSGALPIIRSQAEAGRRDAQYQLGYMYWYGFGLPADRRQALKWAERAANRGHPKAMVLLADEYVAGKDVPRNFVLARIWALKAATAGERDGERRLGLLYILGLGGAPNESQGEYWLTKAAGEGDSQAAQLLQDLVDFQQRQQRALAVLNRTMNFTNVTVDSGPATPPRMIGPAPVPNRSALDIATQ